MTQNPTHPWPTPSLLDDLWQLIKEHLSQTCAITTDHKILYTWPNHKTLHTWPNQTIKTQYTMIIFETDHLNCLQHDNTTKIPYNDPELTEHLDQFIQGKYHG